MTTINEENVEHPTFGWLRDVSWGEDSTFRPNEVELE